VKTTYNKLIRDRNRSCDRILEIIRVDGRQAQIEVMSEPQYRQAQLEKLVEEAQASITFSSFSQFVALCKLLNRTRFWFDPNMFSVRSPAARGF
jgi:predicted house-cleaning noncanonical NTP pyrophosphatase (MazG superfamily)